MGTIEMKNNRTKTALKQVVENLLGTKKCEIRIEYGAERGANFVGEIYRITYKKRCDDEWSSMILKMASCEEKRRNQVAVPKYFEREIRVYQQILPTFYDFQLSKGIDIKADGFSECAKCFFIIQEEPFESLFLEDLKVRNFEMLDYRKDILTFEHVSLAMKALGKFHAISFALRDQQPKLFATLTSNFNENYWTVEKNQLNDFFNYTKNHAIQALEENNCHELSERYTQAFQSGFAETATDCASSLFAEPYAVLCHGDFWTNNSMFRYDANGKPIEVTMFDFQFSRYASPVTDIMIYLLCCTKKALRDRYYDDFIKIYYESLSTLLKQLGSDPNALFPFEVLLDQLKKFGKYGTFTGTILMTIFFSDPNKSFRPDELSKKSLEIKSDFEVPEGLKEKYFTRLHDMLEDAARFGYI